LGDLGGKFRTFDPYSSRFSAVRAVLSFVIHSDLYLVGCDLNHFLGKASGYIDPITTKIIQFYLRQYF
jgi:hypothetical protein